MKKDIPSNTIAVILAAGASKRLHQPKQLLSYKGKTLLENTIDLATSCLENNTIVILGSKSEEFKKIIDNESVIILKNDLWEEGMASSIRLATQHIINQMPHITDVLFMVCDQINLNSTILLQILKGDNHKPIKACKYGNGAIGTPAMINQQYFPNLLLLKGDIGASKIIKENMTKVDIIFFEKGHLDIDTPEDLARLKEGE
jgi:molybdenum cofactor cytidylyltransferase